MVSKRTFLSLCLPMIVVFAAGPVFGQTIGVILRGKVTYDDGSPLQKTVGLQKVCSDSQGATAPGPLTKPNGEYIWKVDLTYMSSRRCFLEATAAGFTSTQVEISNINPTGVNVDVPPIRLKLKGGDPYMIEINSANAGKGKSAFDAGIKAVNTGDSAGALAKFQEAVEANPKFGAAWENLGILYASQADMAKAREAFTHAVEENPKALGPRVVLTRYAIRDEKWEDASKTAAAATPLDKDRVYPELFLHQAVAAYHLKDLAAAEGYIKQALDTKNKRPTTRAEYVLGRILEAKGDTAGAKQHMSHYLELVPDAEDVTQIKAHIDMMGAPGAPEPALENITH